jgi:hypothetical protein
MITKSRTAPENRGNPMVAEVFLGIAYLLSFRFRYHYQASVAFGIY